MSKIFGPGGPYDRNRVTIDTTGAVLLESVNVAVVGAIREKQMDEVVLAMELEGRINKQSQRSDILYMFDADGAAAIISELVGLAHRLGPEFQALFEARLRALP